MNFHHNSFRALFNWQRFAANIQIDFKLMLLCIAVLSGFRIFMVFQFQDYFSPGTDSRDVLMALLNGLRYDGAVSGYVALLSVLVSLFTSWRRTESLSWRLRKWLIGIFLVSSGLICVINFFFIKEYKDNFNQWIFGVIFDDFGAVVKTAWAQYPVAEALIVGTILTFLLFLISFRFLAKPFFKEATLQRRIRGRLGRTVLFLLVIALYVVVLRGSIGSRPVQLKDAGVTHDMFLNKLILNPYYALGYALVIQHEISSAQGINTFLPNGDVGAALQRISPGCPGSSIDDCIKKIARGTGSRHPRHLFLVIMESMDTWSLLPAYSAFKLLPNMERLGRDGLLVKAFLPAGGGTMPSVAAIVSGLPDAGVFTNYQPSARKPYPTSLAAQFKRLGYQTNFFYGGYLSWQRIYDFVRSQGFDHVYGGGSMGPWRNKEWGVDDSRLFEFVLNTVNSEKPSLNVILSTTYHSPYNLPVYDMGFPYRKIPGELADIYDGRVPLHEYGHLWYTDKILGDFVGSAEKKLSSCLFAITGDHWSRKFLNARPTRYERGSVPLVLYGEGVRKTAKAVGAVAGSHLDILPTLIERVAEPGFVYYSLGTDLLDPSRRQFGIGIRMMITPNFLVNWSGGVERLPFADESLSPPTGGELLADLRAHYGVGWWRIMKGSQLR